MTSREILNREIERIQSRLKVLDLMVSRPNADVGAFRNEIKNIEDKLANLKSIISREKFSDSEINPIR
jgi:uncharacterized protein YfkK (UPF0435 family)